MIFLHWLARTRRLGSVAIARIAHVRAVWLLQCEMGKFRATGPLPFARVEYWTMQVILAQPRGFCAGASAPDTLVTELIETLRQYADIQVSALPGVDENVRFRLPPELTDRAKVA